ncbi:hypothetical protein [Variovorax boronicumulans]|uniref:hypothetical protein n=1 Tax=Variovorax boronicumulans TaxID=436515 RepID=UPI00278B08CE|nr:hypothetical protein [Variovorax boronicumulans]MDQ0042815.1 hypothetical protein [Variovorax boronicumulans]
MPLLRRPIFTIDTFLPKGPLARSVNVDDLNLPTQGPGKDDVQPEASLLDLLSGAPDMEGIEFNIPTIEILLQPIDFD